MLPYLDPPALVQRWISNARSRSVEILRKSSVYVAYGFWLSVVFMAIVGVLLLAAEIITIIAGQKPAAEDWTGVERVASAGMLVSVIALGLLVALARRTPGGEFRRRLWRSFTWSIALAAGALGLEAALTICVSYGLLNGTGLPEFSAVPDHSRCWHGHRYFMPSTLLAVSRC